MLDNVTGQNKITWKIKRADNATLTARRYVLVGVTRRQHRAESWYPAPAGPQNCHGARRVWRVFLPSWYKFYWVLAQSRYNVWSEPENYHGTENLFAGTGAVSRYNADRSQKNVKVYWNLIASRCAYPGARTIIKLSWVQELSKNRDKPIKHTVRVSGWLILSILIVSESLWLFHIWQEEFYRSQWS